MINDDRLTSKVLKLLSREDIISEENNSSTLTFVSARNGKELTLISLFPVNVPDANALRFRLEIVHLNRVSTQHSHPVYSLSETICFFSNLSTELFSLSKTKGIFR